MRTRARTVCLLLFDELELLDVAAVAAVLSIAGRHWNWRPFKLFGATLGPTSLSTRDQLRIEATGPLERCPEPEVVIVPGGYGARRLLEHQPLAAWLAGAAAHADLLAGIGYGVLPLAGAGLLGAERAVVPADVLTLAQELAPTAELVTTEAWLASGKLLTARTSLAALDVALEIVSRLLGPKHALTVADQLGHVVTAARIEGARLKPPL